MTTNLKELAANLRGLAEAGKATGFDLVDMNEKDFANCQKAKRELAVLSTSANMLALLDALDAAQAELAAWKEIGFYVADTMDMNKTPAKVIAEIQYMQRELENDGPFAAAGASPVQPSKYGSQELQSLILENITKPSQALELSEVYCEAWLASFKIDNPFHAVVCGEDDKKHISVGLKAVIAAINAKGDV